MRNPYVIQYLESLRHMDGTYICEPAAIQITTQAFPPNTKIPFQIAPAPSFYASIGYGCSFDHQMVPNAFSATITQSGNQPFTGVLTSNMLDEGVEYIAVISRYQVYNSYFANLTNFNQYLSLIVFFLNILETDYDDVMHRLEQLGTHDAVNILKEMEASKKSLAGGRQ